MVSKKDSKPCFLVVDEYYDPESTIIMDWTDIKEEVFSNIPSELLYNVSAIDSVGKLVERTIIYLVPVSNIRKPHKKFENGDIIIGI